MPDPKHIRLFVAIELPAETLDALGRTIEALRAAGADDGLRWVRPEGIHLTLKFLGETDEEDLPGIIAALRGVARNHAPMEIARGPLGSFGGPRNLRVIWVGLAGDSDDLARLAGAVEAALGPLGFAQEARAFNPHLTLARVRDDAALDARSRIHEVVARSPAPVIPAFQATAFSLMESKIQRGGAVYRQVASFPLEAR
jgi:2'-5' RNA ligase